ncbi:exodeoxyribonuclease V subunit beta [uncultured Eudoraea sp.]|uniref:UvrD-helicase domain-containing protein n=1 Tax=uncultured Eudoraea sp. TaxID=1035614 RepID=UPI002638D77B|nr:UvrD-helicase domain-containing protein [uncultured Eudoraea sp.]
MQSNSFNIYNASAGSGKTFKLVQEYLKIVLSTENSNSFNQILAITFTNKAANEMKSRILDSLFEFSHPENPEKTSTLFQLLAKDLNIEYDHLQKRANITLKQILHNYAFFDISTIDKFTHRLIRTFAKDLKIPQNFEVVLDTDLLLVEGIDRLINKAGTDKVLTKVLIDFALEKIQDDKSWDIAYDLTKMGKLLFEENQSYHLDLLKNKSPQDFLTLKKLIQKKVTLIEDEVKDLAKQATETIAESGIDLEVFPRKTLPNHFTKICDLEFNPAKLYNNQLENNLKEGKIFKSGFQAPNTELVFVLQKYFLEIKKRIYDRAFLRNAYLNIVPLTVLNAIQQEIKTIQSERDQIPISSFNTIISDEIRNQPAPYIYERLGEKYRHYFIDEFQDTSRMQWENLVPLISNALESEDEQGNMGTLLLVGDVKQAIYRWRGGRAEQFLNLINKETNPFVVEPHIRTLETNYRSREEIVKFNNAFFTVTSPFLTSPQYNSLFTDGNKQDFNKKTGGYVDLNFIKMPKENKDLEYCNEVLRAIKDASVDKYNYADICILTRKRKHGIILADFLIEQNIPIISSETLLLKNNPKVNFLINLLKHINAPEDSEICYEVLYFLASNRENKHEFIQKYINDLPSLLKEDFNFNMEQIRYTSLYDGLEYAIKQFKLVEHSDAYLTYFMDEVIDSEQRDDNSITSFLDHWEKKKERLSIVAPENLDAVQIMTIHKAKGLEFPIVIYPFANTKIYDELEPKLWLPVEDFGEFKEVLINKKSEVLHYGETAKTIYEEEQHKLELDAFNLLYVALTRAVDRLIIITEMLLNAKNEFRLDNYSGLFIHFLKAQGVWDINKVRYSFGSAELKEQERHLPKAQPHIPFICTQKNDANFNIITQSGNLWDSKREEAIIKGNVIHYALGLIKTESDIDPSITHMIRKGDLKVEEGAQIKETVQQIIWHPKLKSFFTTENNVKNESEIITENGLILRPDRMVFNNNKVTIIDYKTGKKAQKYYEQLYTYADALKTMGYLVENKIIVYIDKKITPEFIN